MVTHHTASPITANARGRSHALTLGSRSVASRIAVMDQSSALTSTVGLLIFSRFHATRQRAEQNRACSRPGANAAPHCSQFRVSATGLCYALTCVPVPDAAARTQRDAHDGAPAARRHLAVPDARVSGRLRARPVAWPDPGVPDLVRRMPVVELPRNEQAAATGNLRFTFCSLSRRWYVA